MMEYFKEQQKLALYMSWINVSFHSLCFHGFHAYFMMAWDFFFCVVFSGFCLFTCTISIDSRNSIQKPTWSVTPLKTNLCLTTMFYLPQSCCTLARFIVFRAFTSFQFNLKLAYNMNKSCWFHHTSGMAQYHYISIVLVNLYTKSNMKT